MWSEGVRFREKEVCAVKEACGGGDGNEGEIEGLEKYVFNVALDDICTAFLMAR